MTLSSILTRTHKRKHQLPVIMEETNEKKMQASVTILDVETGRVYHPPTRPPRLLAAIDLIRNALRRGNKEEETPGPKIIRRLIYLLSGIALFGIFATIVYYSLVYHLIMVLAPAKIPNTGLQKIVNQWREPGSTPQGNVDWVPDFSRDIMPKSIHSHNDYWRRVPLFEALSLGVTGVEADCHLVDGELYVGHSARSLQPNRTFRSLYLDPLTVILTNQNTNSSLDSNDTSIAGVWDVDPSRPIVLMTDLKTGGFETLDAVQAQLDLFRQKGWLTYWNGSAIVPGLIIHVGTGNTPFSAVLNSTYSNSTYRDVFFDAPLDQLSASNTTFNVTNSYYVSTSIDKVLGTGIFGQSLIPSSGMNKDQLAKVRGQIAAAKNLNLTSRYWDIPTWPVQRRLAIWRQLENLDIGMLNADDLELAARWDWRFCHVLGLKLC